MKQAILPLLHTNKYHASTKAASAQRTAYADFTVLMAAEIFVVLHH